MTGLQFGYPEHREALLIRHFGEVSSIENPSSESPLHIFYSDGGECTSLPSKGGHTCDANSRMGRTYVMKSLTRNSMFEAENERKIKDDLEWDFFTTESICSLKERD